MSYKISFILSLVFIFAFILFSVDLTMIQNSYSLLDSKSINISYFLSRHGDVSEDAIDYIERTYDVKFTLLSDRNPAFGDDIIYTISTELDSFTIGKSVLICIKRMAVVGYFN